jgi:DUF3050 family protein
MFTRLRRLVAGEPSAGLLCDYIDRHIELDGGDHTSFAFELVVEVCRQDERRWASLRHSAERALEAREALWDGVCAALDERDPAAVSV